MKPSNDSFIIA